ncbi:MAG: YadA-like family protein [Pelistega sp.]|nr:YadA-like family protein [Pelistega sp.]
MNLIYKVVWSRACQLWVVVSDVAKSGGKAKARSIQSSNSSANGSTRSVMNRGMLALALSLFALPAQAQAIEYYSVNDTGAERANPDPTNKTNLGATGVNALAAGINAQASSLNSVAIGHNALTGPGNQNIAIGFNAISTNHQSLAVGAGSNAWGSYGTAIGVNSEATFFDTAIGANAKALGTWSVALGQGASTKRSGGVAIGNGSTADGQDALAMMLSSQAQGRRTIAIGYGALAGGDPSAYVWNPAVAIGQYAEASVAGAVAYGPNAKATSSNTTAIGVSARAIGGNSIVLGASSSATAWNSMALGVYAGASGQGAIALGVNSYVNGDRAIALGPYAYAWSEKSVALGSSSLAADAVGTTNATIGGLTYGDFAGAKPMATVSIGYEEGERTITNLAAGRIEATSTDAINGSQLFATNVNLGNVANSTVSVLGGNALLDVDGRITMTNIGDTGENTVHDAIKSVKQTLGDGSLKFAADQGAVITRHLGDTLSLNGGATGALSENNIAVVSDGSSALQIKLAEQVNLGANGGVTIGSTQLNQQGLNIQDPNGGVTVGTTQLNQQGLTIEAGPSVTVAGVDAGSMKVINVAPATLSATSTDAVNGSQLFATNTKLTNLATSTVSVLGGNADLDVDGRITMTNIGDTGENTVHDAIKSVKQTLGDGSLKFAADQGAVITRHLGDTLSVNGGATGALSENNIAVVSDGSSALQIKLAEQVNLGANGGVTIGSTQLNQQGLNIQDQNGGVTVGTTQLNQQGLNIQDPNGRVQLGSTQLSQQGLTIQDGPSVTQAGVDAGSKKITHVAPGEISSSSTDAINGSQLYQTQQQIGSNSISINNLSNRIDRVEKNVDGVGATAAAMSSLPQASLPGMSMVAMASGLYGSENAVALGVSRVSDSGKMIYKLNAARNSRGKGSAGVGVGYQW